jgi:hypothetical protein
MALQAPAPVSAVPEVDDSKINRLVAAQLNKTKMCAMFARGHCRDIQCRFAHSPTELRNAPDLHKTAICRLYAKGLCNDKKCNFAHGEEELRVTPTVYKTQLCNFHQRGHCKKGNRCRHAHGNQELRSFQAAAANKGQNLDNTGSENTDAEVPMSPTKAEETSLYEASPSSYQSSREYGASSPNMDEWCRDLLASIAAAKTLTPHQVPSTILDRTSTPPHASLMYGFPEAQFTPEKVMPPLPPGLQKGSDSHQEPMKVSFRANLSHASTAVSTPLNSPSPALPDYSSIAMSGFSEYPSPSMSGRSSPAVESLESARCAHLGQGVPLARATDHLAWAARVAKAAELELQEEVKEAHIKAQSRIRRAAEIAAAARQCLPPTNAIAAMKPRSPVGGHRSRPWAGDGEIQSGSFETIMNVLRQQPSTQGPSETISNRMPPWFGYSFNEVAGTDLETPLPHGIHYGYNKASILI